MPEHIRESPLGAETVLVDPRDVFGQGVVFAESELNDHARRRKARGGGVVAAIVHPERGSGVARTRVFKGVEKIIAGLVAETDPGPIAASSESKEQRRRREQSTHQFWMVVGRLRRFTSDAYSLRHGNREIRLVRMVHAGREILVREDGGVGEDTGARAVRPAVRDPVREEIAALDGADAGRKLLELDVILGKRPLEPAAGP